MLGHRLSGHAHAGAELGEGEPVALVELVQEAAPAGIAQCLEDRVHVCRCVSRFVAGVRIRQLSGCLSSVKQPFGCMSRPFEVHGRDEAVSCVYGCVYTHEGVVDRGGREAGPRRSGSWPKSRRHLARQRGGRPSRPARWRGRRRRRRARRRTGEVDLARVGPGAGAPRPLHLREDEWAARERHGVRVVDVVCCVARCEW